MRTIGGPPALSRLAAATAAATWLLLVAGALVTSTGSGDAVPDWWFLPISYGSFLPPMAGGVLFEHGHRLVASLVGILAGALAVALWRTEARPAVRALGVAAFAAVVVQGILGGLRVFRLEPVAVAVVHASLAQAIFAATVALALATSPGWTRSTPGGASGIPPRLPGLAAASTGILFATLVLGAVMRHTGTGILVHASLAGAAALLGTGAATGAIRSGERGLSRAGSLFGLLLVLQIVLGVASYVVVSTAFQRSTAAPALHLAAVTAHVAVGGALLATSLVLALRARRLAGVRRATVPAEATA